MPRERVAPQSEVIRAIVLETVHICGGPHRDRVAEVRVHSADLIVVAEQRAEPLHLREIPHHRDFVVGHVDRVELVLAGGARKAAAERAVAAAAAAEKRPVGRRGEPSPPWPLSFRSSTACFLRAAARVSAGDGHSTNPAAHAAQRRGTHAARGVGRSGGAQETQARTHPGRLTRAASEGS